MVVVRIRHSGLLHAFVFLAAFLCVAGWIANWFKALDWQWLALLPGLAGATWVGRRSAGSWRDLARQTVEPFAYWPVLAILAVALLAGLLYPPSMLDALTYRLPRLLFWNEAGYIYKIPSTEIRLNSLTHTWGLTSLPFIQVFGLRISWIWNFLSWLAFYTALYGWALSFCGDRGKARQISFLGSTSTFALLQATHVANDLMAGTLLLASLYFITQYEESRSPGLVNWAVLSFALGAGVKPHYATLGLPLVLWFFFARSQPWRVYPWRWAALMLPLFALVSPIPSFIINYNYHGSWAGPALDKSYMGSGPFWNAVLGSLMLVWQAVQPSINPLAFSLEQPLQNAIGQTGVQALAPRFNLHLTPVSMVDTASLGLLTSILIMAGLYVAWRRHPQYFKSWPAWALASAVFGFLVAVARVLPATIGRSSCGFLLFLFPLALAGWATFSPRVVKWLVGICLAAGVSAMVLSPNRPLWPVAWAQRTAERFGKAGIAQKISTYANVQERRFAGMDLVEAIPPNEKMVVALIGSDLPILPILRAARQIRVQLLDSGETVETFEALQPNSIIVSGGAEEYFPDICRHLEESGRFERMLSREYVSKLTRGPEAWSLYRRKPAASTQAPIGRADEAY